MAARGGIDPEADRMGVFASVVLNLSVWLSLHAAFGQGGDVTLGPLNVVVPTLPTLIVPTAVLAAGAMIAMLHCKVGMG